MTTEVLRRDFTLRLERMTGRGDQRLIGGRVVPYNEPALVVDEGGPAYREMFVAGAFSEIVRAANRVLLKFRHGTSALDHLGHGVEFEERPDGLHGLFRVVAGAVGDHALALVDDGVMPGLSLGAIPRRQTRTAEGVVVRQRVDLREVSLCEEPAYVGATISVRRSRAEWDLPPAPDQAQLDRLAAVGIRIGPAS